MRYVDTELDRPRWRTTASHRFFPNFQAGLEFNAAAGEVDPIATWFMRTERGPWPAVFVGTSSDRIGSPKGTQAWYVTAARNAGYMPLSYYASVNYSEWDSEVNFPFGAHLELLPGLTLQPMYDGQRTHLLATWASERFTVSLIHIWLERLGIAASIGF